MQLKGSRCGTPLHMKEMDFSVAVAVYLKVRQPLKGEAWLVIGMEDQKFGGKTIGYEQRDILFGMRLLYCLPGLVERRFASLILFEYQVVEGGLQSFFGLAFWTELFLQHLFPSGH